MHQKRGHLKSAGESNKPVILPTILLNFCTADFMGLRDWREMAALKKTAGAYTPAYSRYYGPP